MGLQQSLQRADGELLPTCIVDFLNRKMQQLDSQTEEITHEKLVSMLGELNSLSEKCLDSDGNQLIFAVKKGTDQTALWRATVQIACVKIDCETQKIITYRLLTLSEFLKVCKTMKLQSSAVIQSERNESKELEATTTTTETSENPNKECCICLERQHEIILPCAHSYCLPCIQQWNEIQDSCPICREKLEGMEDTWVLPEIPTANEINQEIQSTLMDLTKAGTSYS